MERHTQHTRLYAVLELTPTASKEDIRKAYRQLSLRWHPDKHPEERRTEATEKFREVAEAYEVLHDESQRELYDKYGEAGLKGEVPVQDERGYHYEHFEHHSPFDVFREFFANDPWMSQFFGGVSGRD
ncbi:DnaJ domain-containing protein, partial [Syncephalis plumigaleata]